MASLDHPGGNVDALGRDQRQGPPILVAAKLVELDRPPAEQPRQELPGPFRRHGLLRTPGMSPDFWGIDAENPDTLSNDLAEPDADLGEEGVAVEHAKHARRDRSGESLGSRRQSEASQGGKCGDGEDNGPVHLSRLSWPARVINGGQG